MGADVSLAERARVVLGVVFHGHLSLKILENQVVHLVGSSF